MSMEEIHKPVEPAQAMSHRDCEQDPQSAMNFPTHRRVYASAVSWALSFSVYAHFLHAIAIVLIRPVPSR